MNLDQVLAPLARLAAGTTDDVLRWPPGLVSGRWITDEGSVLDIARDGDRIVGTYVSAIENGASPLSGPVSGFVRGDIVALSALLPAHMGAIASWVGQVVDADGTPALKTFWYLIVNIPDADEVTGVWTTVHKGADTFFQATQSRMPKGRPTRERQVFLGSGMHAQVIDHA